MNIADDSSIVIVTHKQKFIDLVKSSELRRYGKNFHFPGGGEDDTVWIIPNIDILGSNEGSFRNYINRIKLPILKYELANYSIGQDELPSSLSEKLFDELLELRTYAQMFPVEKLLKFDSVS